MVTARKVHTWSTQTLVVFAVIAFLVLATGVAVGHAVATDKACDITTTSSSVVTHCVDVTDNSQWAGVSVGVMLAGLLAAYPILALARDSRSTGRDSPAHGGRDRYAVSERVGFAPATR